ncbi:MAG: GntR family transcriptional regulator, partial [Gemmatimonadetes bacterium]|nr:GntR family transcriptional regulator [Gemmatimonadota bacterium]
MRATGIVVRMMLDGILLDRQSRIPLRRQLAGHLESRILGGQIRPGRRLPSVRRVEELLGLHRNTVSAAYRDLVRLGLARSHAGSGVFVKPSASNSGAAARVTVAGSRDVVLECADVDLRRVLEAELRSRLAVRVHSATADGPIVSLRLAPSVDFLRVIRSLPRPSIVAVISDSELVHRLASCATLIHGGEGVGYLPVLPANRRNLARASRLAAAMAADYATAPRAREDLATKVLPLAVISGHSYTGLSQLLRRPKRDERVRLTAAGTAERSL